jgi:hypothetical protein
MTLRQTGLIVLRLGYLSVSDMIPSPLDPLKRRRKALRRRGDPVQLALQTYLRHLDCFGAMPLAMTPRMQPPTGFGILK